MLVVVRDCGDRNRGGGVRELLNEFDGDPRRALAAWYQGPASLRKHGQYRTTKRFVANVMALEKRTI
jgi:hypothetical protein